MCVARVLICGRLVLQPGEAVTQINSWVAESTNNLIDSIVDQNSVSSSSTSLVVVNHYPRPVFPLR
jgi:serine protease inhibitor